MSNRTDRHAEMAEAALRAHQALTQAHVEGREPEPVDYPTPPAAVEVYIPQYGEQTTDRAMLMGSEASLRELEMYWKRIPDFGVKQYQIFANERGWVQVLAWQGTGEDGLEHRGDEVDVVYTDDDFNLTRVEIYSDSKQWLALIAYANDTTVEEREQSTSSYGDLIAGRRHGDEALARSGADAVERDRALAGDRLLLLEA